MTALRICANPLIFLVAGWAVVAGCSNGGTGKAAVVVEEVAEDTADSQQDAGSDDLGTSDVEATSQAQCPGGPGCTCKEPGDCNNNFCIDTPAGKQCAAQCASDCADASFKCAAVPVGGDIINLCIPRYGFLCEPCADSKSCAAALGSESALCIAYGGANGNFCGVPCVGNEDCPGGYSCGSASSVEGSTGKQCLRTADAQGVVQCTCDVRANSLQLATKCMAAAVKGTCPGVRTCGASGLTVCNANQAAAEICDGLDNDCNGLTDEGLCDDKNPCTDDTCDPAAAGACGNVPNALPCSDGNACTDQDVCAKGKCAGIASNCDDNNVCTNDTCATDSGCAHSFADNAGCDDGNACSQGDLCQSGSCVSGKAKDCEDNNACTIDLCDAVTGTCQHKPQDGQPCNDGNSCTDPDACAGDTCKGTVKNCDDGNPCTDDSCDPTKGCASQTTTKACTDGNACTVNDLCDGKGACLGTSMDAATVCNDNNPCTADTCDGLLGCVNPAQAGSCEDGNPCTNGDACSAGKCAPGQNICSCQADSDCKPYDNKCLGVPFCDKAQAPFVCKTKVGTPVICDTSADSTCSKTACNPSSGICGAILEVDGKICNADNSVCTPGDACKGGVCTAGSSLNCDDKNPCSDDLCDAVKGCVNIGNIAPCSDGNACTVGDVCASTLCISGKLTVCDDGSTCTIDSCDKKSGNCVFDGTGQEGDPCDADQTVCTVGDKCVAGICKAGIVKNCDDSNGCTTDSCNAVAGCQHVNTSDPCDFDGNPCTPNDVCANGNCTLGPKKDCDDKNVCTLDSCDNTNGACLHLGAALDGQGCDDGNACTKNDACKTGVCLAGPAVNCDDGDPCTADSCDKIKGCLHPVVADSTPCNDGDACTLSDICVADKCAGVKLDCDDKNPCTVDSCTANGCAHDAVPDGKTVPGACDVAKYCVASKCVTPGCGDGYLNVGEQCDDANAAACDGCEACQIVSGLALDGKNGFAYNLGVLGLPGSLKGSLGLEQEFTIEAWINPAKLATDMPIVSRSVSGGASAYKFGVMATSGKLYFSHKSDSLEAIVSTGAVTAGAWHHVAIVGAKALTFFIDGQPAGTASLAVQRRDSGAPVSIGVEYVDANGLGTGNVFVGSIDAVHLATAPLYGAAFKPARIPQLLGATRALWLMDTQKDSVVADASGLSNDLTLSPAGATLVKDACFGAAADSAVCGDGKVNPVLETCDDGNANACDGCEQCHSVAVLDGATKSSQITVPVTVWAKDAFDPTAGELTIEAWVKPNSAAGIQEIISTSCANLSLHIVGSVFGLARSPIGAEGPCNDKSVILAGKWYHVAATIGWAKGSETRLYVNGVNVAKTVASNNGDPGLLNESMWIGAGVGGMGACSTVGAANFFNGQIDEVRISQGLRYTDDFKPARHLWSDKQTRALWRYDTPQDATLDDSGNGVTAKIVSSSLQVADTCLGEPPSSAICGDGIPARWEGCDKGVLGNGDYPKACSNGCQIASTPDCTALQWSSGQSPKGANVLVYPNTQKLFTAFTIEGWVRMAAYPAAPYGVLVGTDASDGCPPMPVGQHWGVATGSDGTDASFLAYSQIAKASKPLKVWKLNTWQHFAIQYHGLGAGSLYVDGVKVRDFAGITETWDASCPLRLGNSFGASNYYAGAQVAGLRFSKRVRYGQSFASAWSLGLDAATYWLFQMDPPIAPATTFDDTTAVFHIDPKGGGAATAGPACGL